MFLIVTVLLPLISTYHVLSHIMHSTIFAKSREIEIEMEMKMEIDNESIIAVTI